MLHFSQGCKKDIKFDFEFTPMLDTTSENRSVGEYNLPYMGYMGYENT